MTANQNRLPYDEALVRALQWIEEHKGAYILRREMLAAAQAQGWRHVLADSRIREAVSAHNRAVTGTEPAQ
jgi:hypothetical protein